jgi:hypothetical protein
VLEGGEFVIFFNLNETGTPEGGLGAQDLLAWVHVQLIDLDNPAVTLNYLLSGADGGAPEPDDADGTGVTGELGLCLSPMAGYYLGTPAQAGLYLGYAGVPDADVEPALAMLGPRHRRAYRRLTSPHNGGAAHDCVRRCCEPSSSDKRTQRAEAPGHASVPGLSEQSAIEIRRSAHSSMYGIHAGLPRARPRNPGRGGTRGAAPPHIG